MAIHDAFLVSLGPRETLLGIVWTKALNRIKDEYNDQQWCNDDVFTWNLFISLMPIEYSQILV